MNDFQQIKKLLLPLLKGLPIIVVCVALGLSLAYKINLYTNPVYESTIKIKLDDINQGASSAELYANFDVFSHTNKIATEVEMLKSKLLVEKVLDELDFTVSYFREGKIRTKELYNDSPFWIKYELKNRKAYDQPFRLSIKADQSFVLMQGEQEEKAGISGFFGTPIETEDYTFTILTNDSFLLSKPKIDLVDDYRFIIHSKAQLLNSIVGDNLDVVAVDKDVAVIRVSYKSEVAKKAAAFVNTLGRVYVEDYVGNRTEAAGKTVEFIDEQLKTIGEQLRVSEIRLEEYRIQHNIINTRQETETDLRKIAQLKIQLSNLNMNQVALDSLEAYISQNDSRFLELAPNFEAYNDLLSTELIKKIKFYQAEKKDLLLKYTANDEKVRVIDEKIKDVSSYIIESVKNSKKNIAIKREEIERSIEEANKVFIGLPTKEKEMVILNRDFVLNQKIFNFLTEKRTEATIAEAANISFHRIIQKAYVPKTPVSPKKTLTLIVLTFIGLLLGITIVYLREFIGAKVNGRDELERASSLPVAGLIKKVNKRHNDLEENFLTLAANLKLISGLCKNQAVAVTSTVAKEGKTFITQNLGEAYVALGWKVVLLDLNLRNPQLHKRVGVSNSLGVTELILRQKETKEVLQTTKSGLSVIAAGVAQENPIKLINNHTLNNLITELKQEFDLVIIDTPATTFAMEAIQIMRMCEHTYYAIRANFTKSHFLLNADLLAKEYGLSNIQLLLNDAHQAYNFNGNYTGSQFSYQKEKKNFFAKVKHYINYYL